MRKSVVYNSVLTVFRQLIGALLGVVSVMIIARVLGKEGQGDYTLTILLPTVLYTMFNGGLSNATVYFIGQKKYSLEEVYSTNVLSSIVLSGLSVVLGVIVVFCFQDYFFQGIPQQLLLYSLLILPLMYVQKNLQTIFQGKEDFEKFNIVVILNQLGLLFFSVLFVWGLNLGVMGAVFSFAASQLLMLAASFFLLRKAYQLTFPTSFSKTYLKESMVYGIKGHISNVLSFINYRIDMFIIAFLLDNMAVGIYSIAVALAEKIWIVSQSVSSVLFARVANLTSDEERNKFTSVVARNVFFITGVAGLTLALVGKFIIAFLFGEEYEASVAPFLWMIPGVVIFSLGRILANDFSGRGNPEINTYVALIVAATNVALNFILIPKFGLLGAALATSSSYVVDVILKGAVFSLRYKVSPLEFILIKKTDFLLYKKKWDSITNKTSD